MTTYSIPSTGATGPVFDSSQISIAGPNSDQQAAAPFSELLQQAQAPTPAPAPPSPPDAGNSPKSNGRHDSSDATGQQVSFAASGPGSGNSPAGGDPSATNQTGATASDPQAQHQDNQPGAQTSAAKNVNANSSYADNPAQRAKMGPATEKATTAKTAGSRGQPVSASRDATLAPAAVAALVVSPAKAGNGGKQSKDDSHDTLKAGEAKAKADGTAAQPTTVSPPVAAQPVAQIAPDVLAKSGTTSASASDQSVVAIKTAGVDKQVAKEVYAATGQIQTASAGSANSAPAKSPTPSASSATASAAAGKAQSASQTSGTFSVSTSASGKRANNTAPPSQSTTSTNNATAGDALTAAAVQTVATLAVNQVEVVSSITVDQSKPNDAVTAPTAAATKPPDASNLSPSNTPSASPSTFAASLAPGTSSEPAANGAALSTFDRTRFVQRVTRAFQAAGDQGGQIRLRLSPPELGSLQLEISVKQGAMTAHIQADNSTAQQALLDSLPELRDRLARQDIRIDRFDVELTGQSSGGLPQSPQGNPGFDQTAQRSVPARNSPSSAVPAEPTQLVAAAQVLTAGALNVLV